jgi:hypothetical protein
MEQRAISHARALTVPSAPNESARWFIADLVQD